MTRVDVERYRTTLQRIVELQQQKDFEGALQAIDELLIEAPYASALHVRRAMLLQLSPVAHPLEEVERALEHACALDESNTNALLELAHFLDAVRDRPSQALSSFTAVAALASSALKDALLGSARCFIELGEHAAANDVLREANRYFPADPDVVLLCAELTDSTP